MKNLLLTGASGALGQFLSNRLKHSFNVLGLSRACDLCNFGSVRSAMDKNIDYVIHCAAEWNGRNRDFGVAYRNSLMTMNLLSCSDNVKKFIYISSSVVYEQGDAQESDDSFQEDAFLNPSSSYGISKLISEQFVKLKGSDCKYTIWRPIHIVSPHEKYRPGSSHLFTDMFKKIVKLKQTVTPDMVVSPRMVEFTWGESVADCIASCILNPKTDNEVFNISSIYKYNPSAVVAAILNEASNRKKIEQTYKFDIPNPALSSYPNKLHKILGISISDRMPELVSKFFDIKDNLCRR